MTLLNITEAGAVQFPMVRHATEGYWRLCRPPSPEYLERKCAMTTDQIATLASSGESETQEFKETTGKGDWA